MNTKRTVRERKFIAALIKHRGNATRAYLEISPDCTVEAAAVSGCRMLRKANISVGELLDRMGITDVYLNQKLDEGLDATKVISVVPIPPKKGKPGTGDMPEAGKDSIDWIDVPDFNVRVKYLDMAYKLKGKYAPEKIEHGGKIEFNLLNVNMSKYPKDKNAVSVSAKDKRAKKGD